MCKVCEQKQITSKNANQDLLALTKDSAMTAMINLELNPPKNQSLINQIRISNLKQQEKLSKSTASAFQNSYRMSFSQIHPYDQAQMENIGVEEVGPKNDYEEIIPGIIRSLNQSKRVIAQPKLGRAYREA